MRQQVEENGAGRDPRGGRGTDPDDGDAGPGGAPLPRGAVRTARPVHPRARRPVPPVRDGGQRHQASAPRVRQPLVCAAGLGQHRSHHHGSATSQWATNWQKQQLNSPLIRAPPARTPGPHQLRSIHRGEPRNAKRHAALRPDPRRGLRPVRDATAGNQTGGLAYDDQLALGVDNFLQTLARTMGAPQRRSATGLSG
jgi:hypothetical protein